MIGASPGKCSSPGTIAITNKGAYFADSTLGGYPFIIYNQNQAQENV